MDNPNLILKNKHISLVIETQYLFDYSRDFLYNVLSNQAFLTKILNSSLKNLSIDNKHCKLIITKQNNNSLNGFQTTYLLASASTNTIYPLCFDFILFFDAILKKSILKFSIEVLQMTMKKETYNRICKVVLQNIILEIQTPIRNPTQEVSTIMPCNIDVLWNFISSWEYARLFYKEEMSNIHFEGDPDKVGSIIKCVFNHNFECECVVLKSERSDYIENWNYFLEPILGNIELQEVHFSFRKIDQENTLFTFENYFKENVTYEALFNLENRKKRLIQEMQNYFSKWNCIQQ